VLPSNAFFAKLTFLELPNLSACKKLFSSLHFHFWPHFPFGAHFLSSFTCILLNSEHCIDYHACLYVCICVWMWVLICACVFVCLHLPIFRWSWTSDSTRGGGRTGNILHPRWDSSPLHHGDLIKAFPKILYLNY
jgi:hypothetical protein